MILLVLSYNPYLGLSPGVCRSDSNRHAGRWCRRPVCGDQRWWWAGLICQQDHWTINQLSPPCHWPPSWCCFVWIWHCRQPLAVTVSLFSNSQQFNRTMPQSQLAIYQKLTPIPRHSASLFLLPSDGCVPPSTFLVHTELDFAEVQFLFYNVTALFLLLEQQFSVKVCRMENAPLYCTCTL